MMEEARTIRAPEGGLIKFIFENPYMPVVIRNDYRIDKDTMYSSLTINEEILKKTEYSKDKRSQPMTREELGPVSITSKFNKDRLYEVRIEISQENGPCDITEKTINKLEEILQMSLTKNENIITGHDMYLLLEEDEVIRPNVYHILIMRTLIAWKAVRNNTKPVFEVENMKLYK